MQVIPKILFSVLLVALTLPALQVFYPVFEEKPLNGVFIEQELPNFNTDNWFNFEFQHKIDKYLDQNFGFRPSFIRLFNQLQYSIFSSTQAAGVVIGKDNYLFENWYISAYTGSRFVGEDLINAKVEKLAQIKDTLEKYNTKLIIVLAPGKGHYYPEYIPDYYDQKFDKTNYQYYKESLNKTSIEVFDANNWFTNMKDTINYPLFTKTGTHWSDYGATLAADSLLKMIEKELQYRIPHFYWNEIEFSNNPRNADNDLEKLMNLYFKIEQPLMAYPLCYNDTNKTDFQKLDAIVIADSFFWQFFNGPFAWSFNDIKYWYYFGSVFPDNYSSKTTTDDIDIIEQLKSRELLIIMASTANLYEFGSGFIEEMDSLMNIEKRLSLNEKMIVTEN